MRVLLLSFYFEPDIGPGAFRSTAWARALARRLGDGDAIEVLTTQPNRYASFGPAAAALQQEGRLTIRRLQVPRHSSGFVDQSRAFVSYARWVLRQVRGERYDLVCATSSRLMTAALGAAVAQRCAAPLFLDIRDLFVDAIGDVLPAWARPLKPVFAAIERWSFRRASHLNAVSAGFLPYLKARYPSVPMSVVTNGIDDTFLGDRAAAPPPGRAAGDRQRVLYAGNIGDGQGLHLLLPALADRFAATHGFTVLGDGGARKRLVEALGTRPNVRWQPPVNRETLRERYAEADVLLLHLNDLPAFRKVLPSKLFEYLATGKPVLAGVAGHAADFLRDIPGVALFPPCDVEAAAVALAGLQTTPCDRSDFVQSYARSAQMERLVDAAFALLKNPPAGHGD